MKKDIFDQNTIAFIVQEHASRWQALQKSMSKKVHESEAHLTKRLPNCSQPELNEFQLHARESNSDVVSCSKKRSGALKAQPFEKCCCKFAISEN